MRESRDRSDREIRSFGDRLMDHVTAKWSNYERFRLELDNARNYLEITIAGEFIAVERASSGHATAEIRLDWPNRDEINFDQARIVQTVFERLYISNAAQTGEWLDIIIGRNFKTWKDCTALQGGEALQVLNVTAAADTNIACAAQACRAAHIKADVENTGITWIDFGAAAVQSGCTPLDPGEWIIIPLSNTNRINANFEVANEIAYITPVE